MVALLALALVIAITSVVFALQNAQLVTVHFLFWRFEGNLALILLVTFAMGFLMSLLALLPQALRWHARKPPEPPLPAEVEPEEKKKKGKKP